MGQRPTKESRLMRYAKWLATALMLSGATTISLQLNTLVGLTLMFLGNTTWVIIQVRMREWAASLMFAYLACIWLAGLIKYLLL
jgi:hypothetical protein